MEMGHISTDRTKIFVPLDYSIEPQILPQYLPDAAKHEKFILINRRLQYLGLYERGNLKHVFPISSGSSKSTPLRNFVINHMNEVHYSKKYDSHMDLALNIGGDYYIHEGIVPGYAASHGCIRLFPLHARFLFYKWAKPGIPGKIIRSIIYFSLKEVKDEEKQPCGCFLGLALVVLAAAGAWAQDKPNILVIMGDDIGYWNLSYNSGAMMGYKTPNIDRIAAEGVRFTDYYGEQSCTAGRAAFITGQMPVRTGLTKVGLPGADLGIRKEDPTLAELLKPLGYATGQFGKNHLGDKDEFLPTAHGFDEFFGNLYHLNAEEAPENPVYPKDPAFKKKVRPPGRAQSDGRRQDRGHRAPDHKAHGNGGQGISGCGPGLHGPPAKSRQTLSLLVQFHPDALSHPRLTPVGRQVGPELLCRRHAPA